MSPQRIQRKRAKGWRKPEGAVYVGRGSKWGNFWRLGEASPWHPYEPIDHAKAVELFRYGIGNDLNGLTRELRGRDLMCWCPLDQPCHADVLLELANRRGHGCAT